MTKSIFKCLLYITVAVLTSLSTEINNINDLNTISVAKWIGIALHSAVQGLIAWKAFLDQTITTDNNSNSPLENS
jgi:hypothetical protein